MILLKNSRLVVIFLPATYGGHARNLVYPSTHHTIVAPHSILLIQLESSVKNDLTIIYKPNNIYFLFKFDDK